MTTPAERRPSSEETGVLAQFAAFLDERRKKITARWMDAVRESLKVGAADALDHRELADHLPALFEDLSNSLSGKGTPEEEARDDAERHGFHRWRQDYSLGEVLRELGIVRHMVLVHGLDAFEDSHPAVPKAALRAARECVLRFFEETAAVSMEQYVEQQHKQLHGLNTQLLEAGEALKTVNAKLHGVDASRLQLLRTVSHELRNTLSALNGAVMVLGLDGVDEAERQKMFMVCHRNFADISQLLKELTDYSILLSGHNKPDMAAFSPALLCEELTASYRLLAQVQGVDFEAYPHPALPEVGSDRLKIKQVLANLISNAIKYRKWDPPAGSHIKVSFRPSASPEHWEIAVEDDGIGIAAEHLQTIFDEFQRLPIRRADAQGAGLGLAITRRIVHLLGGRISVTSEPDHGSRFTVTLPRVWSPRNGAGQ